MTQLVPFGWWHIPAAFALELQLFPTSPWSEAQFWSELAADDRTWFAAMDGEELVGYAGIAVRDDDAEIMTIAVRADHQGRGVGRALLEAMLEAARSGGASRVLLEVETGNRTAIALYEHSGFQRVGLRPNYYGAGIDALLMERHG